MNHQFPADWYWRHDDGRFFTSARCAIVSETDPDLIAWIDAGGRPTRWPEDDDGEQTDAALQKVLRPHGLYLNLSEVKAALKTAIDDAADAERLKYITGGMGQAMTYARKVEEAKAIQADADPEPEDYPMLAASIGIDGNDLLTVAATVLAMDAAWARIGAGIEAARLSAKAAIGAAETVEAARAVQADWPQP